MRDEIPTLQLELSPGRKIRIPSLQDQSRPRRLIFPGGSEQMEYLPIFARLNELGDDWYNMPGLRYEYDGLPVWNNLHIVEPQNDRYGGLPLWFPSTDSKGRKLTPTAQVDRFLAFLGNVATLPEDHRTMDPLRLVEGLFALYDAYENGAFEDWDKEHEWQLAPEAQESIDE